MAAVTVSLPQPLRRFAGGEAEVTAAGADVAGALAALCGERPELGHRLLDADGLPRRVFRLYLNGADVRDLRGLETALAPGDRLAVVLPLAGG